jgi:hypothetical protein
MAFNQTMKFAPYGRRTLVPRAVYCGRYALKQMPLRQHAFVQDADNFNNTTGG